jgi:hypothetical protein
MLSLQFICIALSLLSLAGGARPEKDATKFTQDEKAALKKVSIFTEYTYTVPL